MPNVTLFISCFFMFKNFRQRKIANMSNRKLFYDASDRNKSPILQVIKKVVSEKFESKNPVNVLEVGSGTGQHAVYFCKEIQKLLWQPSEIHHKNIDSIKAYLEESKLPNLKSPIELDAAADTPPIELDHQYDMLVSVNLVHITPWRCSEGLFRLAGKALRPDGVALTYGPYSVHGKITPESNVQFNRYLKIPLKLDVSADAISTSKLDHRYDMLVAINLIHVSPWKCSEGLFSLAGNVLCPKGVFLTYGAYSVHGKISPDSNVQFNKYLKSQNPEWGLRDTDDLENEARKNGLELETMFDMPANNKTLLWRRLHSTKL
ncbi:hypothetical protein Anas_07795 [Armadillidium nasatum]|uniref:Methyltransferase-like 26 n=1 Tax=Armadillidium nasatum TaxID=96803 RepID=A0A5N5T6W5_9CRUS|nr:hypothetical protein Anas_07795 [Armadillidium nasatum]